MLGFFEKCKRIYPDVELDFMQLGLRQQNIENNQEIHDINKRFAETDTTLKEIKEALDKILEKLEK